MLCRDADSLFEEFEYEAFRFEARSLYRVEPEFGWYVNWARTRTLPDDHPFPEWQPIAQQALERQASFKRVRLFTTPVEPYVEFEIELFRRFPVGEDIRLFEVDTLPRMNDFWLFDDEVALVMRYDDDGTFLGSGIEDDPGMVQHLIDVKTHHWIQATPLD